MTKKEPYEGFLVTLLPEYLCKTHDEYIGNKDNQEDRKHVEYSTQYCSSKVEQEYQYHTPP